MLQTAILERLNGSLCDSVRFGEAKSPSSSEGTAVSGQDNGREILEMLERGNLFIVPLDGERQWYRYHHLFADLLRQRLRQTHPEQIANLHIRASEWYEQNGFTAEAIAHALRADDFERAAGLIELAWPAMEKSYIQSTTWHGWVRVLPDELVRSRPVLSVAYAWGLLDEGQLEAAEARLRDAERWLETPSSDMVVADEDQFQSLPGAIATARAYQAQARGDVPATIKYTRQVLGFLPEEDYLRRGQAITLLGLAYWSSGDLEAAHQCFADFLVIAHTAGDVHEAIGATFVLADIKVALGRLHEALSTCEQALQLAVSLGEPMPLGTEDLYRGMSELYCEWGDLQAAEQHLLKGEKQGEQAAQPNWSHRLGITEARMKEAQGDLEGALDLLDEAERVYIRTPLLDVRPIAALKARIWIAQGKLAKALAWARERGLSADDDLGYLREFEHVTLARVLIARYKSNRAERSIFEAMGLLERLLEAAERGKRMGSVIEILTLQALAHQAQGNTPLALASLERALALAEPEGYVRTFVDKGAPMARLLSEAAAHGIAPDYAGELLAVFEAEAQTSADKSYPPPAPPAQSLIEPLSPRELEVLQLIAQGLSNREICERLFIALDTVKGHNRRMFGKLEVQRRTEAVARARELGLL